MRATAVALALGGALCVGAGASGAEIAFPELTGPVVDQAAILSPAAEQALDAELRAHQAAHGAQVVVVTLSTLGGRDIADYGFRLGRHWGIGDAERDDGALLIVAPNERAVRIEVGRGLEGRLTDALSRIIIEREVLPRFKQGDYDGGVRAGVGAILLVLRGQPYAPPVHRDDSPPWWVILLAFGLIVLFVWLIIAAARTEGGSGGWVGGSGYRGGGRGHGGFGGGFGGGGGYSGGGGGFSGGGASGRW